MATLSSNSAEIARSLADLAGALNLRQRPPGANGRLGDELADTAALAIEHRSVSGQSDPSGNRWAELAESTVERKARAGLDPRINIETYEMLRLDQLRGDVTVTADTAVMRAGLDPWTRAKVGFAEEGGPNRPARGFYDLGPDGEAAVDGVLDQVIDGAIVRASR